MNIVKAERILAIRDKMRQKIHAAMDEAEQKLQQLQEEYPEPESNEFRRNHDYYPRMKSPHIRDRQFSVRISLAEEQFLKEEALRQKKSAAELIREGHKSKIKNIKTFERI